MPTNDFLPFATDPAANVVSQGSYAAMAARAGGYQAGLAQSPQLNKTWRQASAIAAMLGQFIVDYGNLDALDDGNIANLVRDFARALQIDKYAYAANTGTANALVATFIPAPVSLAAITGAPLRILVSAANTGAMTLAVNGLAATAITWPGGTAIASGEVAASIIEVIYDGTAFRLYGPFRPASIFSLITRLYSPPLLTGSFSMTGVASGVNTNISGIVQANNTLQDSTLSAGGLFTCGAKDAGVWNVTMRSGTGNAGDEVVAELLKNGGTFGVASVYTPNGGPGANAVGTERLAAGDTVQVRTRQINSGAATRNMTGTFSFTRTGA